MKKKRISLVMALVLVLTCVIGGTIAWLTDKTEKVVNTFTVGDINIILEESDTEIDEDDDSNTNAYKMVPGNKITKDPEVTVEANSEASWLFVKIEESENFSDFMKYEVLLDNPDTTDVVEEWTALSGEAGVYYRQVPAVTTDTTFAILKDNEVTVKDSVTKEMLNALDKNEDGTDKEDNEKTYPTLTLTAYAVQKDNIATAAEAWAEVINQNNSN